MEHNKQNAAQNHVTKKQHCTKHKSARWQEQYEQHYNE